MNLIEKAYLWLRDISSKREEQGMYSAGYWQNKVRGQILRMLSRGQGRLLELGCGEGLFLSQLDTTNAKIQLWGVDRWEEALQHTKKRFNEENSKAIRLVNADANKLPFKDGMFDVVVCANLLICVESVSVVRSIIQEAERVCRKNGTFIVEFRNKKNMLLWLKYSLAKYYDTTTKSHPLSTYDYDAMVSILKESGFAVIKTHVIDFPLKGIPVIFILEARKIC
ncbi:MAG: hypothetical protein A2Y00_07400 [Omnitrophica WOR_2 bacterium GWF2_43_52]|nr:MAG: hypothetical protein A2Y01_01080 [Omnitrophica WOR_2 bacterium GWC2_44_8]OGX20245.1 MAG: hypothetical protein A2Y00_07400 [Omnitrophica WOR_2 bacterium GWF2_43_52]HAH20735.1 hypothetical protein [Candidatus Omnitrophota bacterium]HBG63603.1 hypothetical protein [Candidatus Omnitrophota bacterium]HCD39024.1 hypothetical protein [Candidatus Omnitrophota bacterium]